jgi:circadian clock protein KaiB
MGEVDAGTGDESSQRIALRLYVSAPSAYSHRARRTLEELQRGLSLADDAVEVIDVFESPERAAEDRILATPTLLRLQPLPQRKLIGEFDLASTLEWLGVSA